MKLAKPAVASALNGAIGASSAADHLDGSVDEVAVYNRALTAADFTTRTASPATAWVAAPGKPRRSRAALALTAFPAPVAAT